jgi:hypothetical protein
MVKPRNASSLVGEQRTKRSGDGEMFLVRCEAGFWERRAGGRVYMRWGTGRVSIGDLRSTVANGIFRERARLASQPACRTTRCSAAGTHVHGPS